MLRPYLSYCSEQTTCEINAIVAIMVKPPEDVDERRKPSVFLISPSEESP